MKSFLKQLYKQFTADEEEASVIVPDPVINNKQMSKSIKLMNLITKNDAYLGRFLLRDQTSIRLPKWVLNKARIEGAKHGGISRYIEALVIKDLKLTAIEKDLGKEINAKAIRDKQRD